MAFPKYIPMNVLVFNLLVTKVGIALPSTTPLPTPDMTASSPGPLSLPPARLLALLLVLYKHLLPHLACWEHRCGGPRQVWGWRSSRCGDGAAAAGVGVSLA